MSTLKVNSIIPVAGVPTGGGGGIIQIKQAVKSNVQTTTASYGSWVDIADLSVSITPTSSSSKILVNYSLMCSSDNTIIGIKLLRGSTAIGEGSGTPATTHYKASNFSWTGGNNLATMAKYVLDSPATTSATTYKLQFAGHSGNMVTINDFQNYNNYLTDSSLTVMEVSA
tara:strand:- start:22 stop:531 length:510 start_codon:yes stop_codon:yes gene_type:complete